MRKILLIAIGVALLAVGAWYLLADRNDGEPRILSTTTIQRGTVRKVLEATGIVKAQVGAMVKIGARATGIIERMPVKVGDRVNKGDLVAVIDDREQQAEQAETEARLASAQAELSRVRQVYPLQIAEAQAQLDLAQAQYAYAQANFKRQQDLVARDVQPQDILDQARRDLDVSRNELEARQATLRRLRQEFEQELTKARRAVDVAQATLRSIKVRISYTRITTPISGLVSQVTAQEGETVVSGLQVTNLVTVIDPTRLEMWIYVDETDVGQVKPGMPVEFRVDAYQGRIFQGRIEQIYPEPEIRDNIVYYRALVPLDPRQALALRPEMTTQCQIVVEQRENVPALPNTALKWVGDRQVVFVRGPDGVVREINPQLGLQGLESSEIVNGLQVGDVVATQVVIPGLTVPQTSNGQRMAGGGGGGGGGSGQRSGQDNGGPPGRPSEPGSSPGGSSGGGSGGGENQ
ncbi:RND family efflux transporter, MFP subunit [Desulfocurvibacter africanus PCS]|uniref:RND family efflux transporter, MFP subunit n=1 Tax=Desulfocurvibacter africanus PCS TaxID=1262666 RepID=M5PQY9_DESAF|nr:efflux RND transporter periplasmic adaptor subunit [Desulfocurvibacter africanus]EMG36465.1 RND family efflux transporter, MFP subunit [Desulfocurvibacter africanus PCS]